MTEANIFRACHSVEGACAGTATELTTTTKRAASRSKQGTFRSPDVDMPEFEIGGRSKTAPLPPHAVVAALLPTQWSGPGMTSPG